MHRLKGVKDKVLQHAPPLLRHRKKHLIERGFNELQESPSSNEEIKNGWHNVDCVQNEGTASTREPNSTSHSNLLDMRRRSQWLSRSELEKLADSLSMDDLLAEVPVCDSATCDLMESIYQAHYDLQMASMELKVLCNDNDTITFRSPQARLSISMACCIVSIIAYFWDLKTLWLISSFVLIALLHIRCETAASLPAVLIGVEMATEHVEKATGKLTTILTANQKKPPTPRKPSSPVSLRAAPSLVIGTPRQIQSIDLFFSPTGQILRHSTGTIKDYFDLLSHIERPGENPKMDTTDWPLRHTYFRFSMSEASKNRVREKLQALLTAEGITVEMYNRIRCCDIEPIMKGAATIYNPGALLFNACEKGPNEQAFYEFETEAFLGRLICRATGFDHLPAGRELVSDFFRGKRRVMQFVCQGVLKRDVPARALLTGQVFQKPLKLPPAILVKMGMMFMRSFNSVQADDITSSSKPYFISPLITSCQTVNVTDSRKGDIPPDISSIDEIPENCTALGGDLDGPTGLCGRLRRKYFSNLDNLSRVILPKGLTYTFESYQHQFRFDNFQFDLGIRTMDISTYLDYQPIEVSAFVDEDLGDRFFGGGRKSEGQMTDSNLPTEYLWRLEVFSRRAVENQGSG